MNAITSFRKCTLSNEDLLQKVDEGTDNMYKKGKIPDRQIPARPDDDYDLLVGELILRFKESLEIYSEEKRMIAFAKYAKDYKSSPKVEEAYSNWVEKYPAKVIEPELTLEGLMNSLPQGSTFTITKLTYDYEIRVISLNESLKTNQFRITQEMLDKAEPSVKKVMIKEVIDQLLYTIR
jgi:hypothetical protein